MNNNRCGRTWEPVINQSERDCDVDGQPEGAKENINTLGVPERGRGGLTADGLWTPLVGFVNEETGFVA